jgi:hypothetical protein
VPDEITAAAARTYFADNAVAVRAYGISLAAGAVLLVVLLGQLRALIGRAEGGRGILADVAHGCGLLVAVWLLVSAAMNSMGGFIEIDSLSDDAVVQLFSYMSLGDMIASAATFAQGGLMLAVGIAALRTRVLPRWFGWLSVVLGAMAVGGGLSVADDPVTEALWYGGLLGFGIWPLLAGVVLVIKGVRARRG